MSRPMITPRHARPPRLAQRISGLRSPSPRIIRSPSPAMLRSPSPALSHSSVSEQSGPVPCPNCGSTQFEHDSDKKICQRCGLIVADAGNYASEIGFQESEGGRTTQMGQRVNEGQTHQRVFPQNLGLGRAGRETTDTSQKAREEARYWMQRYMHALNIAQPEQDKALVMFSMAYNLGFVRGRTISNVATICLYLATRRAKNRNYGLMLIDFAEIGQINVFDLGKMMQDLVRRLYLLPDGKKKELDSFELQAPGAEVLIDKFVRHLDFGPDANKIRHDATRIIQRMKRDWIHSGRRPAGVCGAAVILAARMNNYRRTLREVVLCAKVTEFTIGKRLEEFKETDSSRLSVDEFRDDSIRNGAKDMDPPAYYRGLQPKVKRKRGRPRKHPLPETAAELEGSHADLETPKEVVDTSDQAAADASEPPTKRARVDADGFAVPALPVRPTRLTRASLQSLGVDGVTQTPDAQAPTTTTPKRGPGKPKGSKNWKAPPPTAAELAYEEQMQVDIQTTLDENEDLAESTEGYLSPRETSATAQTSSANVLPHDHSNRAEHGAVGMSSQSTSGNSGNVNMGQDISNDEFDDDPEIANCILNENERKLKERIWVTENAEWLRQDHAKRIRRELRDAHLREQGLDPEEMRKQKGKQLMKRKDGARRSGRVGDVEYLQDDFHKAGRKRPAQQKGTETAEENRHSREHTAVSAIGAMFKQRGTYSRRINYAALETAYQLPSNSPSRSPSIDPVLLAESLPDLASPAPQVELKDLWKGNKPRIRTKPNPGRFKPGQNRHPNRAEGKDVRRSSDSSSRSASPSSSRSTSSTPAESTASPKPTPQPHNFANSRNVQRKPAQTQLPTPSATQNRSTFTEEESIDTDSPLSSTHTPIGTGSAAGTPTASGSAGGSSHVRITRAMLEARQRAQNISDREDDDEDHDDEDEVDDEVIDNDEDEDDREDDEDEDDEEEGEDDIENAFAGKYLARWEGEDEVVDD